VGADAPWRVTIEGDARGRKLSHLAQLEQVVHHNATVVRHAVQSPQSFPVRWGRLGVRGVDSVAQARLS
jgi:hypothetical protein